MERIFVLDVDQERSDDPETEAETRRLQVFINPEIIWESAEDAPYEEGCLSIPEIHREIYRPKEIKIVARDENFELFETKANELFARVIQHELDHLNGVLFIDHLSRLNRALIGGELNRIKQSTHQELPQLPADHTGYPVYL
jgi:peptide deformylase